MESKDDPPTVTPKIPDPKDTAKGCGCLVFCACFHFGIVIVPVLLGRTAKTLLEDRGVEDSFGVVLLVYFMGFPIAIYLSTAAVFFTRWTVLIRHKTRRGDIQK